VWKQTFFARGFANSTAPVVEELLAKPVFRGRGGYHPENFEF
jgi:hypothetical protein